VTTNNFSSLFTLQNIKPIIFVVWLLSFFLHMYDTYLFQIYTRMHMLSLTCKYDDSYTIETFEKNVQVQVCVNERL